MADEDLADAEDGCWTDSGMFSELEEADVDGVRWLWDEESSSLCSCGDAGCVKGTASVMSL